MLIDCADCVMRDIACGDCVVTFLIGPPDRSFEPVEQAALAVLADGGLVPPLRMVSGRADPPEGAGVPRPDARPPRDAASAASGVDRTGRRRGSASA